jgi:iron complex outermembrane receptor protein
MSRIAQENLVDKSRYFRNAHHFRNALIPTAASLLSVPAALAAAASTSTEVEQVVVTAQKQAYRGDTPLQELPQSVQTLTAEVLKDVGVTRLDAALDLVSGVARQNNFGGLWDAYAIRGFAGNENLPSGFLVNGFNAGRGFAGPRDLSDVERIEVVKGPSSALFGRGEPGGTVNIVTKKPLFKEQGSLALSGGRYDNYRAEGDFTSPFTESIAGRINGAYERADSFRDTVTSKKYVITPSVLARLGEQTSISYEFEYVHQEAPFDRGVVARNGVLGIIPISTFLGEPGNGPTVVNAYSNQVTLQHDFNGDWTLLVGFGALNTSLKGTAEDPELGAARNPFLGTGAFLPTNILSRRRISRNYHGNDLVPRAEITGKFTTGPLAHHILFGADYDDFKLESVQGRYRPPNVTATSTLAQLNAIDIFNPVYGILPPLSPFTHTLERDYAWGTYAHDQIDITPQWKFHAGVRYDNYRQRLEDDIAHSVSHQKVTATSPSFGLVYEPFDVLSLYASYGKGFRPNTGQDAHGVAFAPETTKSYEVGAKFKTPEGALSGTVAIFRMDKTNVLTADPTNAGFSLAIGAARSKGVEADMTARLPLHLRAMLSYAYVDAYISKSILDPNFARPLAAGSPLINIPAHSGNLTLFEDIPLGQRTLTLGAGANYVDKRLGETGTSFYLPSYTLVKLVASYDVTDNLQIWGEVNNLLDKEYYPNSYAQLWVNPGAPRTYSVRGTYKF